MNLKRYSSERIIVVHFFYHSILAGNHSVVSLMVLDVVVELFICYREISLFGQ